MGRSRRSRTSSARGRRSSRAFEVAKLETFNALAARGGFTPEPYTFTPEQQTEILRLLPLTDRGDDVRALKEIGTALTFYAEELAGDTTARDKRSMSRELDRIGRQVESWVKDIDLWSDEARTRIECIADLDVNVGGLSAPVHDLLDRIEVARRVLEDGGLKIDRKNPEEWALAFQLARIWHRYTGREIKRAVEAGDGESGAFLKFLRVVARIVAPKFSGSGIARWLSEQPVDTYGSRVSYAA